jgi:hypothetical protein
MNYQTKYLKENDFTKKECTNFLKPTCLLFITQIGFAQFTIPEKPSLATQFTITLMFLVQPKNFN